jgi:putative phosphoribosyl transferase
VNDLGVSYRNRVHAGQILAQQLKGMEFKTRPLVLAIPNGGVAVGAEIARSLDADLDVIIVRKLQVPGNPEAGFGALTSQGALILNDGLVRSIGLHKEQIDKVVEQTQAQIEKRRADYWNLIGVFSPEDRDVILVDDGIASGYTMVAAIESVESMGPASITVVVPTCSKKAAHLVRKKVGVLLCPRVEAGFIFAVANAYEHWYDVPDSEVLEILKEFRQ